MVVVFRKRDIGCASDVAVEKFPGDIEELEAIVGK
jgi:hypothetical protein